MTDVPSSTPLPTWEGFLLPTLYVLSNGETHQLRALFAAVQDHLQLTDDQRWETVGSGQSKAENRIGWALSALTRAEVLHRPSRGHYAITVTGRELLRRRPQGLTEADLRKIPAYQAYTPRASAPAPGPDSAATSRSSVDQPDVTPREQIETGVSRIDSAVAAELLDKLRGQDPAFLEQSVLDVLVAMGYGGAEQRARRIGGTGDGGVDGVIDQDALGLDQVYVQAKRYGVDKTVGREAVQSFVGALHGVGASRGVFITTSSFTSGAREYVKQIPSRVILIDGARLAALMIRYRVGVRVADTFSIVEVDEDYFV